MIILLFNSFMFSWQTSLFCPLMLMVHSVGGYFLMNSWEMR